MKTKEYESLGTVYTHAHTDELKNIKGITLVALVITIIILLILAGITITQLMNIGLFEKAKLAKEKSENSQEIEDTTLADYENNINQYLYGTREYNNYELLATFNNMNEEKEIENIKNYKEFDIVIIQDTQILDVCRYNINLYDEELTYTASYYNGASCIGKMKFLSETNVKMVWCAGITEMRLYGLN